jgi:hypothetical protein
MAGLSSAVIPNSDLRNLRYKELHELRIEIAKFAGIDLLAMDGYGGEIKWDTVVANGNPLVFFLITEDTKIELSGTDALLIAPEFEKFWKQLPDTYELKEWVGKAVKLMDRCALLGEPFIIKNQC